MHMYQIAKISKHRLRAGLGLAFLRQGRLESDFSAINYE